MRLNEARNFSRLVEERIDRGFRKNLEERFENFLASTHSV